MAQSQLALRRRRAAWHQFATSTQIAQRGFKLFPFSLGFRSGRHKTPHYLANFRPKLGQKITRLNYYTQLSLILNIKSANNFESQQICGVDTSPDFFAALTVCQDYFKRHKNNEKPQCRDFG